MKSNLEKKSISRYNINYFEYYENQKIKKFFNDLFKTATIPLINRPCRITNHSSGGGIDNIFTTDFFNKLLKKSIIKTDLSDHFPIFFLLELKVKKENHVKLSTKKRLFNIISLNSFREQLSLINWDYINFWKRVLY